LEKKKPDLFAKVSSEVDLPTKARLAKEAPKTRP
jgi:hypothetical protein